MAENEGQDQSGHPLLVILSIVFLDSVGLVMTCEAEKQALAEILKQLHDAEDDVEQEKVIAELDLLRSDARIFDWRAVRVATMLMRVWDTRRAQAERALEQCKKLAQKD